MTDRAAWELAARWALRGHGFSYFHGNMQERFDEVFPLNERFPDATNAERCLAMLFMAAMEDS